jgi:hypothetical protein
MPDKFVTIEDLANIFAVSISTARAWVRTGAIPKNTYIKIGHTYRFNLPRVVEALTEQVEAEKQENAAVGAVGAVGVIVAEEGPEQLELDLGLDDDA